MTHYRLFSQVLTLGIGMSFILSTLHGEGISLSSENEASSSGISSQIAENKKEIEAWMTETAQVAKDYVAGLDKGQYGESWSKADRILQKTISQNEWEEALIKNRKPLGKVNSRSLKLHHEAWDPKGLPKGPYMVIEYDTSFEKVPNSRELLTFRKGEDGKWKVLTYQVN